MPEARETRLTRAFVELADTLVSDYDVAELLQALVEHVASLLGASASGLMLTDQRGSLQVVASSTERAHLIELFQIQSDQGPCLDCFSTGEPVAVEDLSEAVERWPDFVPVARDQGFNAVYASPLRLRSDTIGALNVFMDRPGKLTRADLEVAQALADVATIGILHQRAAQRSEALIEQLQGALNSRIVIEQAKGMLAEHGALDMEQAFARLRRHARSTNTVLTQLARDLVDGRIDPGLVLRATQGASQAQSRRSER